MAISPARKRQQNIFYIYIYIYVYINIALSSHAHTLKVAAQLKSNRVSVGCKDTKPKLKDKATTVRSSARWTNKTAQRLGPNTWLGPQKRQRQNKAKAKAKASKVRRNCAKTGAKWKVFRLELSLLVCRVFLANAFVLASLAYGVCFFLFFWPGDVKTFAKSALNWFAGRRSNWFYTRIASHRNGLNRSRAERTCISEIHPLHSQWPKEMAIEVGFLSCRLHTPEVWWTRWFWQFGGANWFHFPE